MGWGLWGSSLENPQRKADFRRGWGGLVRATPCLSYLKVHAKGDFASGLFFY